MALASILIPVFNREHLISRTIAAAQAQTVQDIEIIIADNASTDGTCDVVSKLAKYDARIRLVRNDANLGPVRNWQVCVEHATAAYAKLLFSDDLIAPNYLERTLRHLLSPECGLVYSYAIIGTEEWKGTQFYRSLFDTARIARDGFLRATTYLDGFTPVSPGAAVLRTADLRKNLLTELPGVEGYDFTRTGAGVDWLVYALTALQYQHVTYVDEPLVFFRSHPDSITIANEDNLVPEGYRLARQWLRQNVRGL